MSNYYAAVIRATRASAMAVRRMQNAARALQDAKDYASRESALKAHDRARHDYNRAQDILASHPLSADDIAARQASYPKAQQ